MSGPLGKKTSLFASGARSDQKNNAIVNAFNPGGTRLLVAVAAPLVETSASLRLDRRPNPNNTLVSSYEYDKASVSNDGVGLPVLPSEGTTNGTTVQTFQAGNTQLIGPKLVSETRLQYLGTRIAQTPVSTVPTIVVQGAFNGGGSPLQTSRDSQNRFEFQEYLVRSRQALPPRRGAPPPALRDEHLRSSATAKCGELLAAVRHRDADLILVHKRSLGTIASTSHHYSGRSR